MRSMQLGSYERMISNAAQFFTGYIQVHNNGFWDDKTVDNSMPHDTQLLELIANNSIDLLNDFPNHIYGFT